MGHYSYLFILLLLNESGKLHKNVLVVCYDEDRMHEAIQRASREIYTEEAMLSSVSEYIAAHKFFGYDPRNGQVCESIMLLKCSPVVTSSSFFSLFFSCGVSFLINPAVAADKNFQLLLPLQTSVVFVHS